MVNSENTSENDKDKEMDTRTSPASLSGIAANAKSGKAHGGKALGVGLEARGIHAWFDDKHVLNNVSLDFWAGTVTALIGPSGCGKSTFIRTLNRMHEFIPGAAMAGEVLLDGNDIYAPGTDVTKIRLKVGMVFQKPNPFPSMTIAENVLAGLKLAQIKVENKDDLLGVLRAGWSMGRGKGSFERPWWISLRRSTAAVVYCSCARGSSRSSFNGRALLSS